MAEENRFILQQKSKEEKEREIVYKLFSFAPNIKVMVGNREATADEIIVFMTRAYHMNSLLLSTKRFMI